MALRDAADTCGMWRLHGDSVPLVWLMFLLLCWGLMSRRIFRVKHIQGTANHRVAWVGRGLKDCPVPIPLLWTGLPAAESSPSWGCPVQPGLQVSSTVSCQSLCSGAAAHQGVPPAITMLSARAACWPFTACLEPLNEYKLELFQKLLKIDRSFLNAVQCSLVPHRLVQT